MNIEQKFSGRCSFMKWATKHLETPGSKDMEYRFQAGRRLQYTHTVDWSTHRLPTPAALPSHCAPNIVHVQESGRRR
ncbi:hypothetical protein E2C01_035508 [Portunus trituberculatus]|uniref:Uncharacterized protein n=1 Tax=Portunus trituberculatus TaxID=210409 RepID=A0A5B7F3D0_PORTR|nr:hypothetical protein [Portunus trituberculatus]